MEKKNNKLVIILMGVIIVILGVLCYLFATGTISLNNKNNSLSNEIKQKQEETEDKNEYVITYQEETYTTTNSDGKISTTNKRNIPTIENKKEKEAAKKIEETLRNHSENIWNSIKKSADEYKELTYEGIGVSYIISNGIINKNRLTFIGEQSGSFGGVSWPAIYGYNFDAQTGETLSLESISNNSEEFKRTLKENVIIEIETQNKESDMCLIEDLDNWKNIIEGKFNEYDWIFVEDGIEIIIPKYDIACGAAGVIVPVIDKEIINNYLKEKYKI